MSHLLAIVLRAVLGRPTQEGPPVSESSHYQVPDKNGAKPKDNIMTTIINIDGTSLTSPIAPAAGGFVALGMAGNKCVVLSSLTKAVTRISPSDMKEMFFKTHFGATWCDEHYSAFHPKKEEVIFDHRQLATDIIRDCQAQGPYIESYERKAGVWLNKSGKLLINSKQLWTAEGNILEHGIHDGRIYSASGSVGFDMTTPKATNDDVQKVLNAFGGINWRQELGAELLLGWIGVATMAVVFRRRPHMLLTGGAGIGKSTVLEMAKWLLGPMAFTCTGPQTMAAFYQALGGTSRAVILDEFEADPSRRHAQDTLEIARMSYSLQEGDEGIVRGTQNGTAKSYAFYSPFLAAGISPGKMQPADLTRWVVLEALSRKGDAPQLNESEAREIGPRLARLFVSRWNMFQASEKVVRECILAAGGDGRMADTVGTLLASYWTFASNRPATADDANVLVEMLNIKARIELHSETDEKRCLDSLMSKVMPFKTIEGQYLVTRPMSIAQAIEKVCEDPTGNLEITSRLSQLGMRVVQQNGKWRFIIANSPEHQELRRLFSGTKWSTGGWAVVLRRLPGGEESTQRIGAGFGAAKVTVFDVPADLLPANDEGEDLLAA